MDQETNKEVDREIKDMKRGRERKVKRRRGNRNDNEGIISKPVEETRSEEEKRNPDKRVDKESQKYTHSGFAKEPREWKRKM